jgi:putative ATPase
LEPTDTDNTLLVEQKYLDIAKTEQDINYPGNKEYFDAVNKIGYPESRIILSQCVTYLASSAKSNASYMAINEAISAVQKQGDLQVPLHIRNAPTQLMKKLNYGKDYTYSHNYENNFTPQEYLPDELKGTAFYKPGNNPREQELQKYLKMLWKEKYGY